MVGARRGERPQAYLRHVGGSESRVRPPARPHERSQQKHSRRPGRGLAVAGARLTAATFDVVSRPGLRSHRTLTATLSVPCGVAPATPLRRSSPPGESKRPLAHP
jgi:hypothetical protein